MRVMSCTMHLSDRSAAGPWRVSPWIHREEGRLSHPLTNREVLRGQPGYDALRRLAEDGGELATLGEAEREWLVDGWLEPVTADRSHDFRLRFVSLETCSNCTQGCYFCPVASRSKCCSSKWVSP